MAERDSSSMTMKLVAIIMGLVAIMSIGWGASQRLVSADLQRMDERGTQKAQELEVRVSVLEKLLEQELQTIRKSLTEIQTDVKTHIKETVVSK